VDDGVVHEPGLAQGASIVAVLQVDVAGRHRIPGLRASRDPAVDPQLERLHALVVRRHPDSDLVGLQVTSRPDDVGAARQDRVVVAARQPGGGRGGLEPPSPASSGATTMRAWSSSQTTSRRSS
jgi:hypothetical protein